MWIFTRHGFYSVVKDDYCNDGELMIRGRVKGDLERLIEQMGLPGAEIITLGEADYRYRVKVLVNDWAGYVARQAADIDYPNVKGTLAPDSESERVEAYFACWSAMYDLQERLLNFT